MIELRNCRIEKKKEKGLMEQKMMAILFLKTKNDFFLQTVFLEAG